MSEKELEKLKRHVELMVLETIAQELDMPENIKTFMTCFIKNGCPLTGVIKGMVSFCESNEKKEDQEQEILRELLKGLNIELE